MGLFSPPRLGRAAVFIALALGATGHAATIPATRTTALDGHAVTLPAGLPGATVIILGFTRHSIDATTAWEKPTRTQLAHLPNFTFYDTAMLASVPHFARGFAIGRVRKAVPDVLRPNFLPLVEHEEEWKQAAGFDSRQQDAAYVVLVDHSGSVRWATHEAFTPSLFAQLRQAATALAAQK